MIDPDEYVSPATVDAGVSLSLCLAIEPLLAALDRLAGAFRDKGRELEIILEPAGAHPQDAASTTLSRAFEAFATTVSEDRMALQDLQRRFVSGHPEIFLELCRLLTRTAMKVSRICHDLRRFAAVPQTGIADIVLPARQTGVAGHDALIVTHHDVTTSFEPVMMRALLDSLHWMTGAIVTLRVNCIEGIAANATRVDAFLSSDRLTRH